MFRNYFKVYISTWQYCIMIIIILWRADKRHDAVTKLSMFIRFPLKSSDPSFSETNMRRA